MTKLKEKPTTVSIPTVSPDERADADTYGAMLLKARDLTNEAKKLEKLAKEHLDKMRAKYGDVFKGSTTLVIIEDGTQNRLDDSLVQAALGPEKYLECKRDFPTVRYKVTVIG